MSGIICPNCGTTYTKACPRCPITSFSALAAKPDHVTRIEAIERECKGVWAQSNITSWERERLAEWRRLASLSARQLEVLTDIETKAFSNADRY